MTKNITWGVVFILVAALLQSTVFSRLALYIYVVPDFALCILVYSAYVNGVMTGQLTGFLSGFLLDFLSAAPLGLNAFIRTVVGAVTGYLKGTFFLDVFFLPMALCAGATAFKAFAFSLLHLVFTDAVPAYNFLGPVFWVELTLNSFCAPPLFGFLKLFESLLAGQKESV